MSPFPAFEGRRVLLTGDTGFKGAWLALWLGRLGARVHGVGLEPETEPSLFELLGLRGRIEHTTCDVRDPAALDRVVRRARPEVVFHLAAQALVRRSYAEPASTMETNVLGTVNLLEAVRNARTVAESPCVVVVVTSDKCYLNRETCQAYREDDPLGGHDPYSASKAAAEIVAQSWRASFFDPAAWPRHRVSLATARAGNVIGGGDWAADRIVPDVVRALAGGEGVLVRSPRAIRPWQHVLDPLGGYLALAQALWLAEGARPELAAAFNFGPGPDSERPVSELVRCAIACWGSGAWSCPEQVEALHEAGTLKLATDKARALLGWAPAWPFEEAVSRAIGWYRRAHEARFDHDEILDLCEQELEAYEAALGTAGAAERLP